MFCGEDRFVEILNGDMVKISTLDIDDELRAELLSSWRHKSTRAQAGDHRWGLFRATK